MSDTKIRPAVPQRKIQVGADLRRIQANGKGLIDTIAYTIDDRDALVRDVEMSINTDTGEEVDTWTQERAYIGDLLDSLRKEFDKLG